MNVLLCMPMAYVSRRMTSHKSAQAIIYADMVRQAGNAVTVNFGDITDYTPYDAVYVYHGNDFSGGLNIFGGLQAADASPMVSLSKFTGPVYSLAIPFPSYHEMVGSRIASARKNGTAIRQEWLNIDLANLAAMQSKAQQVVHPLDSNKLVIGDSHSICLYRPGWMVNSVPFTTLNGALNRGLDSYIHKEVDELDVYFGNIDIRHHLCRLEGNYIDHTVDLAKRYAEAVNKIDAKVSVYEPLPIENESRKLPKTGYYDGKPFWGSWQQRNEARNVFIQTMQQELAGPRLVNWTNNLMNDLGELSFDKMEKPQSIHLARSAYPFWTGADISG